MTTAQITSYEWAARRQDLARDARRGMARSEPRDVPVADGADDGAERLAHGLGWFSIGLGLAELTAPSTLASLIGVPDDEDNRSLLRAAGLREISSGIGILSQPRPAGWLWARVGGDVMDLALLGAALNSPRARRDRVALATAAVLGVTVLDVISGQRLRSQGQRGARVVPERVSEAKQHHSVSIKHAITINRPVDQVYHFWHDFQNLPRFMSHLESVTLTGEGKWRWKARGPVGSAIEWEAEVTEDKINERIVWCTSRGDIDHRGSVRFTPAPGKRGTEMHVELHYRPPAGALGAVIAHLFGELPEQQIKNDLRAFKQVLETGEVVHSDASVHRLAHPGRPPEHQATLASEVLS
jgi:uncharacterized membrane protein